MSGVELCRAVRADAILSALPFILLTAKTDVYSKIEGTDVGADVYLEKPFSLQYLLASIRNLLKMRAMLYHKYAHTPLAPLQNAGYNRADEAFLTQITQLIEANFANPELSGEWLADHVGMSRSQFFGKVKLLTDSTPGELIQTARLKAAAAMLSAEKRRVSDVCYAVGFNNPSYFTSLFKKQFGMTPMAFAANNCSAH
jgi:AraC-like DNA-binding protein